MLTADATTLSVLSRSFKLFVRAESWLGGTLLADGIPIAGGNEEGDSSARVPERVTLTVPRRARGVLWAPTQEDSPLAANGQRLRIEIGVGMRKDEITWLQRGWFVITDARPAGDSVVVEAASLLWLIDEAKLVSPLQPTGTMLSTMRTLLEPTLTVRDVSVGDRPVPAGVTFDDDRLGAAYELLDAWATRGRVNEHGEFVITGDFKPTAPLRSYTDGVGGTVIEASGSSSRTGGFSLVVARGQDTAGNAVQGVAYQDNGPRAFGGPFNPQPVPTFFYSPLLATPDQARAAAQTILARKRRESGREFTVQAVPDPTLQLGDPVMITGDEVTGLFCTVEGYSLPYKAGAGSMRLTVRAVL